MRVLTVTHFFASHGGGIERVAGHLCRELVAAGHHVEWAASAQDAAIISGGVAYLPIASFNPTEALTGLPMPIPGPRGLARLIKAVRRADVVIVHDALYVISITAMLAARWFNRPVVLVQHIAELEFANPLMRRAMKLATAIVTLPMLRAATQVVFISDTVCKAFAGVRLRKPAKLLFNGVDRSIFHARGKPSESAAFRAEHGLSPSSELVAFVGRFVPKKGLAVLREVATHRPDLTFVLAGNGPIDPAAWKLGNVQVLGALAPEAVGRLLRSANTLLLPSVGEGYPLVVQEALACGLPVICGMDSATADPGASCWLHGIRIEPGDPPRSAARILPLLGLSLADSNARAAMADYAARTYSWAAMAEALVADCKTTTHHLTS